MSDLKSLKLAADTVRLLSADGVQKAKSGHPGMPMGTADVAFTLWYQFLKHNPKNPNWLGRDRFVLSAGHGSMLIYSLLHLFGYGLTMEDLRASASGTASLPVIRNMDIPKGSKSRPDRSERGSLPRSAWLPPENISPP